MLKRLVVLRDFVFKLDNVDLDNALLPAPYAKIDVFLSELEELSDMVLKLQLHSCTIRKARAYVESVLDVFSTVEARLNQSSRIVHSPNYESAVVKIYNAMEQDLTS